MDRPGELRQLAFLKIAHSIPGALPPPCSARPALGGRTPWGTGSPSRSEGSDPLGIGPAAL